MEKIKFVNMADIPNNEGITPRQINKLKVHKIPKGSLVELDNGLRLFVVSHERDCDETPLYGLSFDKDWEPNMYGTQFKKFARWALYAGVAEETMKIIKIN